MNKVGFLSQLVIGLLLHPSLVNAQNVELSLIDKLDGNLNSYCFDIVGGGANIDPANGLQAHTCYSYRGELGTDQAIDPVGITNGVIHLVDFNVCAALVDLSVGSAIALEKCNDSDQQQFIFAENGTISPKSAANLCLTAGVETQFGRNGTSPHQIKALTLQPCQSEHTAYQQWVSRAQTE